MKKKLDVADVAEICHEANRAYARNFGEFQAAWNECPQWQRASATDGVLFILQHPLAGPQQSHENWLRHKSQDGWQYGAEKDPANKKHPCMVAFSELPEEQQIKDVMFHAIVNSLREVTAFSPHSEFSSRS